MHLDIAPFAEVERLPGSVTYRWEEPRDIHSLRLRPSRVDLPVKIDDLRIEYWQRVWPASRPTEQDLELGRIGRAAWKPQDDWFNGCWRQAAVKAESMGEGLRVIFLPLTEEFPELDGYPVAFRRTLKLRISLPVGEFAEAQIYTDSEVERRDVHVELRCGQGGHPATEVGFEVYNGQLEGIRPSTDHDPRIRLSLLCSRPGAFSHDATVVTVHADTSSFSFKPEDLARGEPIWIPNLSALVSLAEDDLLYGAEFEARAQTGESTYDRIEVMPEQSLATALADNPPKRPMHFVVGVEGRRQKFGMEPNGDVFAGIGYVKKVPGPDTAKVSWQGSRLYYRFHYDQMVRNGRSLEDGYLPILRSTYSLGALDIRQEVLATVIDGEIASIRGEDLVVALVRLTYTNGGDDPIRVHQLVGTESAEHLPEGLELKEGLVSADSGSIRMSIKTGGRGRLSAECGSITYLLDLPAGESHETLVAIPFADRLTPREVRSLQMKDWETERSSVRDYWIGRIGAGAEIHTGVPDLDDFYKALLTHILINDDHEVGSNRVIGRVSSFNYGNFPNESVMQIMELDRRGFHDEAKRHLDTYLEYQGTVSLPGNFSSKDGLFYGSGGYECGDYNQHHGWVLFGLAQHYRYTGDRQWLESVADGLAAGCRWVVNERRATMRLNSDDDPVREYGWLPAGSVEDVREFCYWLSTNALTYRGLALAAEALSEVNHPEGQALVEEAERYREDLLRGVKDAMLRSPVVSLRDGTYVPHIPSRLHWRGRDVGWIREVLEGSIIAVTNVLDVDDQVSTWILKDFEDNRYLDSPFNYPLEDFENQWFSRGGFSMQPNLVYTTSPYMCRDQIKHFLRAFFNAFAACWRPEIRAMTEHPLPTLADWAGDHFKSSDESMSAYSMRLMFIYESGDVLHLGRGLPRRWLSPGSNIWIKRAETEFGRMSLVIEASADGRGMRVSIDPPTRRSPAKIVLRLRHPDKWRITKVELDGERWDDFGSEEVFLPPLASSAELVVGFDTT